MNVLIIGSGGREHALAYKISESKNIGNLFISPGNPGTTRLGINVNLPDHKETIKFCSENNINLVVVGPEQPLIDGIADELRENNITVFGPSQQAAQIEGDKVLTKKLLEKYKIPTAKFKVFNNSEREKALTYVKTIDYPAVVKAYGLAAGKGVVICSTYQDAEEAIKDCFVNKKFGSAGDQIIIEEFLTGNEASVFAITDGTNHVLLPVAQDHKRIFDGDRGKNTGGMGAYAPTPQVDDMLLKKIESEIIIPTLHAMKNEGMLYNGCLYAGLMLTENGPKVIEFNCRFGDPETQVVLPILEGDFLELLYSSACGNLSENAVKHSGKSAVCIVASSKGYPESYNKGIEITGIENAESDGALIFHAGTKFIDDKLFTNGGRVLGVTAVENSNDLISCKKKAYAYIKKINFEGMHFRTDISDKAFN